MDKIITARRQRLGLELLQRSVAGLILYIGQRLPRQRNILGLLSWQAPFLVVSVFIFCAGLTLVPAEHAKAAVTYTASSIGILPIGSTRVVRMANDSGEIVGTIKEGNRGPGGTFWGEGGRHRIKGRQADSDYSSAFGINNKGQVVGSINTDTGMRAFRSQRAAELVFLDQLSGDTGSAALAVSLSGKAAGWSSGPTGVRAVIWSPAGKVQALPMLPDSNSCRGLTINNGGDVAGVCDTTSGPRAVLWEGGSDNTAQDLGMLSGDYGSEASSINSRGDIVGTSVDMENRRRAVLWPKGNVIRDLGSLPNQTSSKALAINNRGEVVGVSEGDSGEHAFVWTNEEGIQDLNDLLSSSSGFVFTHAISISSHGRITAIGHDEIADPDGHSHEIHALPLRIFLLSPVEGP